MNKISKRKVRNIVERYGADVKTIYPSSKEETNAEAFVNFNFPPDLEQHLPPDIAPKVTQMRKDFVKELLAMPHTTDQEAMERAKKLPEDYISRLLEICNPDIVIYAFSQSAFLKKQKGILKHNVEMQDKVKEYQARSCTTCGDKGPWKRCGGCKKDTYYCNRSCQAKDWPKHKTLCTPIQQQHQ
jgi:hypothetical protein